MRCCEHRRGYRSGKKAFYKLALRSKNTLHLNSEAAIVCNEGEPLCLSYPADHSLAVRQSASRWSGWWVRTKIMENSCPRIIPMSKVLWTIAGRQGVDADGCGEWGDL